MPTGQPLSAYQLGQIDTLKSQGMSIREIARQTGISHGAVGNYVNRNTHVPENYKKSGPPKKMTPQDERAIGRMICSGNFSLREIQRELPTHYGYGTIQKVVKENPNVQYEKRMGQPKLTEEHKQRRLQFAQEHMSWDKEWKKVVFSDEKKFNLDGPDGWQFYWHDLRKEPEIFSQRQMGGGSVMMWGAFGYHGRSELVPIPPKTNSVGYQQVLEGNLLRQGTKMGGRGWIFQQDNASIHNSASTKKFLDDKGVRVLDWPSRSPDLNPMENLWAELSRRVYAKGRQYNSKVELERSIHEEWSKIPQSVLQNLNDSMKNRIFKVILNQGGYTDY